MIVTVAFILGEILFFTAGPVFAFGLFYGTVLALAASFINFNYYKEIFERMGKDSKENVEDVDAKRQGRKRGFLKYALYGFGLAVTTFIPYVSFYAAAGGLLIPRFSLQSKYLLNKTGET